MWQGCQGSNRNSLDDIARYFLVATVIEPRSAGICVPKQVLDVLQRHALIEQICGRRGPERVARQNGRLILGRLYGRSEQEHA